MGSKKSLTTSLECSETLLRSLLIINVPKYIHHIKLRGGVSKDEWEWLQNETEDIQYPQYFLHCADSYLMFPKSQEIFEKSLFTLTLALALMSFVPLGVRFLNIRFCSEILNYFEEL